MTETTTIRVHMDDVIGPVSPYLTGACIEDVNHEVYGGIYSQMLFGECFEEEPQEIDVARNPAWAGLAGTVSCRAERTYLAGQSEVRSWQPFRQGTAEGAFTATALRARRGRRSQKIEFRAGEGAVGIENRGLNRWGLDLVGGQPYDGVLTLLAESDVEVEVALESGDGAESYAAATLTVPGDKAWHDLSFTLTPSGDDPAGRLTISLHVPGAVWVDYAFLQPGPWGRFHDLPVRRDIADALVAQGLTVLRYGGYMINTDWEHEARCPGSGYRWKKGLGPRPERPPYLGTFYPYNTNGFGVVDFVALCEAAGFLCIPALSPSEDPADVADLVEYLNSEAGTPWGRRRVADGHPEPYGLRYLQIGNEELLRLPDGRRVIRPDYPERFCAHLAAIAARDPEMTVITSPWLYRVEELAHPENREIVRQLLWAGRGQRLLWDVHVGGDGLRDADKIEEFIPALRSYLDEIDPENAVRFCILEENGVRHDLQRALGHAHNINTVERLGGEVVLDCAANCLQAWGQNDNHWDQGQLFYTPGQAWGMPPYTAQQMIARHYQPLCIRAEVEGAAEALDVTATRSEDGRTVVLKVVNLEGDEVVASLALAAGTAGTVRITSLAGALDAENTPEEPQRVAPTEEQRGWRDGLPSYRFAGHSFTVLAFTQDQ